jgi:hypothetical protein
MDLLGAYKYDAGNQLIYVFTMRLDAPMGSLVLGEGHGMALFAPDDLPGTTVTELRTLIEGFVRTERYRALWAR